MRSRLTSRGRSEGPCGRAEERDFRFLEEAGGLESGEEVIEEGEDGGCRGRELAEVVALKLR